MPITCLSDFIGFRGLCDTDTPGSGLYINDLVNVSTERLEAFTDTDAETFRDVWLKAYGRAQDLFKTDVRRILNEVRKDEGQGGLLVKTVLNNYQIGRICDPKSNVSASAQLRGLFVDVYGTPYMSVSIPYIEIYSRTTQAAVPIYIYNTLTGIQVYSGTADLTANQWNRVNINQSFSVAGAYEGYFVCYDGTNIDTLQTDDDILNPCTGCNYHDALNICGATSSVAGTVVESDLTKDGYSRGVRMVLNLNCSVDAFICAHRDVLANALRYASAIALLEEQQDTDHIANPWTLTDPEKIEQRRQRYIEQYERILFYELSSISVEEDGVCFECQDKVNLQFSLP